MHKALTVLEKKRLAELVEVGVAHRCCRARCSGRIAARASAARRRYGAVISSASDRHRGDQGPASL